MLQKIQKMLFSFQIIAFVLGVANSHNLEQDTCNRQSMCSQTRLRFYVTLGETFYKSTFLKMLKNMINTLAMTITFSFKMFKIWCRFQKWNKKLRKCFFILQIVPFELGV